MRRRKTLVVSLLVPSSFVMLVPASPATERRTNDSQPAGLSKEYGGQA